MIRSDQGWFWGLVGGWYYVVEVPVGETCFCTTPCTLFLYLTYWGGIRGNTTSFGETWNFGWTNLGEAPFIDLHLTLLLCTSRCCQFTQTVRRLVIIDNIKCNNQKQAGNIILPPPYPTPQERDDGFRVSTQCNAVCWCTQHAHALVSSPRQGVWTCLVLTRGSIIITAPSIQSVRFLVSPRIPRLKVDTTVYIRYNMTKWKKGL